MGGTLTQATVRCKCTGRCRIQDFAKRLWHTTKIRFALKKSKELERFWLRAAKLSHVTFAQYPRLGKCSSRGCNPLCDTSIFPEQQHQSGNRSTIFIAEWVSRKPRYRN